MDAAHTERESLGSILRQHLAKLDKPGLPMVDFGKAQKAYDAESIRRFQKEMWRDGKGTGYICYYERFDV